MKLIAAQSQSDGLEEVLLRGSTSQEHSFASGVGRAVCGSVPPGASDEAQ